jgi:phosphopantothenoylcysteine decarboxylase/phosphopantothenate--cysteine ligase
VGPGRLAEPEDILAAVAGVLGASGDLAGTRVLVSAGGTREPIDAVRVITNRSSGKQGHAVAEAARRRGAEVVLVTTTDRPVPPGITVVRVDTAGEMEAAVLEHAARADVVVMAAAVADFRPKAPAPGKIAKADGIPEIVLEPTPDILAELGRRRRPDQVLVGFAAETRDVTERARGKLAAKGIDLIVANDVGAPGVGFDHDTNAVTILGADGSSRDVALQSKGAVAEAVLDAVVACQQARPAHPPGDPTSRRAQ